MSNESEYKAPQPAVSLNVLPHSGKVDQLRKEMQSDPATPAKKDESRPVAMDSASGQEKTIEQKVIDAISTVYDPEIPVNIYELGLIYDVDVDPQTNAVYVQMTLTAPGCPVAGTLPREVQKKIETVPGVPQAVVELVWDPPWTKDRMSEAALLQLGLL